MVNLSKNDVKYIISTLNHVADEYAESITAVQESGLKRLYGMQLERNKQLAITLQKALETGAKRIAID